MDQTANTNQMAETDQAADTNQTGDTDQTARLSDELLLQVLGIAAAEQARTAFPALLNVVPHSQRAVADTDSDGPESTAERDPDSVAPRARPAGAAGLGLVCRRWRDLLVPERTVLAPRGPFSCSQVLAFLRRNPSITKLRLSWDYPAALSGSMFAALSQVHSRLTSLQLDYGEAQAILPPSLPPEIAQLSSLEELEVLGDKAEVRLPGTLGELQSLKSLFIARAGNLPDSLARLTGLTLLELRNLNAEPPPSLEHLHLLEALVLHWRATPTEWNAPFAPQTWNLRRLKSLSLLSSLLEWDLSFHPSAFESFPRLKSLTISPGRIRLPPSLFQRTSLQELDLGISPSTAFAQDLPQFLQDLPLRRLCLTIKRNGEADNSASLRRLLIGLFGTPLQSLVIDGFNELPEDAEPWCTIALLRHFELRNGGLSTLPRALIGALRSVQSFSIVECSDKIVMADVEGGLYPNLETMSIGLRSWGAGKLDFYSLAGPLSCATNLKKLSISCPEQFCNRSFSNHITRLTNLCHVELDWSGKLTPAFCTLPNLESLNVRSSDPEGRLGDSFGNLRRLTSLTLDLPRSPKTLPDFIGNFAALRRARIKAPHMKNLPRSLGNLRELRTLELETKDLEALPESISGLGNLEDLTVRSTTISALPSSFCDLPRLKSLHLKCPSLAALPEKLGALTSLTSANVRSTRLQAVPRSTGNLTNLLELKIESAKIPWLPPSLANLRRLKWLSINARLTVVPEWLSQLSALCQLELRWWCSTGPPEAANRRAAEGLAHSLLAQMPSLEHVRMAYTGERWREVLDEFRVQVESKAGEQGREAKRTKRRRTGTKQRKSSAWGGCSNLCS